MSGIFLVNLFFLSLVQNVIICIYKNYQNLNQTERK